MPNTEVIQKWVTALESGDYQQTKGKLHREESNGINKPGYCCLGVLCEIAVQEGIVSVIETRDGYDFYGADGRTGHEDDLPIEVQTWAGLNDPSPEVEYEMTPDEFDSADMSEGFDSPVRTDSLAELNDEFEYDFKRIAGIIRDNFLPKES